MDTSRSIDEGEIVVTDSTVTEGVTFLDMKPPNVTTVAAGTIDL